MKIVDNFLDQESFSGLEDYIFGNECTWFYYSFLVDENDKDEITAGQIQFVHAFCNRGVPQQNSGLDKISPILELINPMAIYRILASFRPRMSAVTESLYHVDVGDERFPQQAWPEEKIKQWTTAILYMNTTNGYTKFEDGTKIECIANRFVTFPMNTRHCGTAASDKNKIVINFNYFK